MTWARAIATGRGTLSFRLSIEGVRTDAVTSPAMERNSDAAQRARRGGLSVKGVKLSQQADLIRATVEAKGANFTLADIDGVWTDVFGRMPEKITWVDSDVTVGATTMTVKSTEGFTTGSLVWVDSEVMEIEVQSATAFHIAPRGLLDTLVQAHYVPNGAFLRAPMVSDRPVLYTGRRVRLYVYGAGDDPQGNGTQIWLGVLNGEPRMQGASWSLGVDPISSLLDQEVGADLGPPVTPRGIYLPGRSDGSATARITITRLAYTSGTTTNLPELRLGGTVDPIVLTGFYGDQAAFLASVQTKLDTLTATWGTKIFIRSHALTGSYYFELRTVGSPDGIRIAMNMPLSAPTEPVFDGTVQNQAQSDEAGGQYSGPGQNALGQNQTYYAYPADLPLAGSGQVPRGSFNSMQRADASPWNHIYLGGSVAIASNTTLPMIKWVSPDSREVDYQLFDVADTANRKLSLMQATGYYDHRHTYHFTPSNLPTVRLGRAYDDHPGTGTYSLLKTIEDDCAEQLNTGAVPSWRSGDWDSAAWLAAYSEASAMGRQRRYSSLKPSKLREFLCPDLQLAGLHLAFDSTGRLTVKKLRLASPTEPATFAINATNLLTDDGLPQYERGAVGQYNAIEVHDGYDAVSDKYTMTPVKVRDVAASGAAPAARTVKVEPKSSPLYGTFSTDEVVALASQVLGIYGGPYAYVSCDVPLTAINAAVLGDTVSITTGLIPDASGTRGVTQLAGIVTSRDIDLYGGRISLTILVSLARISGYAFGARITGQANTGGNTWNITLSADYFAAGDSAENHLLAGDYVQTYRFDSGTYGYLGGTVDAVAGNVATVTFLGVWTPGADEWSLAFEDADGGDDSDNQRRYCYIAQSDGRVGWVIGSPAPARQFAP